MDTLLGQGRAAIDLIVDTGSFEENNLPDLSLSCDDYGVGAVVGSAKLNDQVCTVIANDGMSFNPRFPVVYAGVIGLEEAYKMAMAVYCTVKADADKPLAEKRPLLLIVDTPGNGPGKVEEIIGMNKATGAYQLALAEARMKGHPIIAVVIGRAISGAFLCHGLQADHIVSLSAKFQTMIHVMPLTSISRITKLSLERLNELAKVNPVFAPGPQFFYQLGGIEALIEALPDLRPTIIRHVEEVSRLKQSEGNSQLGPQGRGLLGNSRGGRTTRMQVLTQMKQEFSAVAERYL
ncbi:biotin-independent malonate decarboxylase subunit gamma [Yersinia pseudotuberculosis]|uniref:Acetyl-CoA carboxylase, carboxyltransferase component (Subunits alpha and beta) n=1 Tax=Yersinia pseudotuberculosis TaxID=633 RepID=A0A0T9JJV1_YERPU|nr:biotin-independent malonate decarboxylase subunit gamma [Yersinia pseudotuberculosis]PSH22646.1 biotin-independent malonate decarboxylase subunit gamma [Yersinia pseudotuberculosis]CNC80546.1 Acetyl-CoA carboxylase%2C carboxyltransferase component (subunits alpha and beta) [Yersinia pseudotuberculosis]SUP80028.1 Acetyl-CoA carboxylase, carboxyltransferase component (subunits alpha and beta) [Yersinia pseudotuberculosis]